MTDPTPASRISHMVRIPRHAQLAEYRRQHPKPVNTQHVAFATTHTTHQTWSAATRDRRHAADSACHAIRSMRHLPKHRPSPLASAATRMPAHTQRAGYRQAPSGIPRMRPPAYDAACDSCAIPASGQRCRSHPAGCVCLYIRQHATRTHATARPHNHATARPAAAPPRSAVGLMARRFDNSPLSYKVDVCCLKQPTRGGAAR